MKRTAVAAGIAVALSAGAYVAWASSPEAWDELQQKAEAACMAASGLNAPEVVAPPTNFEHQVFVVVKGEYASGAMKGEKSEWVCLYDKEHDAAEAREPGFP